MDIEKIVQEMTLEEKASLLSGGDFWHTKAVERLGIPRTMVSDGPHGLRKQDEGGDHLGVNESIQAVCFPAGCAQAASFDRELVREIGENLGDACLHEGVDVLLGPAVNIKRSPLCGRNFEYLSEDPCLAGELAASMIGGVQSRGVGTSIKHFAANSQEHRRMSSDSVVDERTLREIYFPAFETAVKKAQPWTVMCSYNKVNGTYASENRWLLTDVLRDEWGFDGYVMSDWGAVSDRVKAVAAGLDLEMPSSCGSNDRRIVDAVRDGRLDERDVDLCVTRILRIVERCVNSRRPDTPWDMEAQHALAGKLAAECMVLLKNEDGILPFKKQEKIAVIGRFARRARFQGGGSSHINCFRTESLMDALKGNPDITFAEGYDIVDETPDEKLIEEAVKAASCCDKAVIVAGLPDSFECEGYDRSHMRMPECQNELIRRVAQANPNTVVVLYNGSPVEIPWLDSVKGLIEAYLGGQAVGAATRDVLWGEACPGGRLPESFPVRLEDNPSWLSYGGEGNTAVYSEGIFTGYRYYDRKKMAVRFPFGYGLSYTTFDWSDLKLQALTEDQAEKTEKTADGAEGRSAAADGTAAGRTGAGMDAAASGRTGAGTDAEKLVPEGPVTLTDRERLKVSVTVTNTGSRAGKEVVQLYVGAPETDVFRPVRELKEFAAVHLEQGESRRISFVLDGRAFAYWHTGLHDWYVPSGTYRIELGRSSRDLVLCSEAKVKGTRLLPALELTPDTIFMDLERDPEAMRLAAPVLEESGKSFAGEASEAAKEAITGEMNDAMRRYMPLRGVVSFGDGSITYDMIQELLRRG